MSEAFEDRTLTYEIGGKTLVMKPLPFGDLRRALGVVERVSASLMQIGPTDPVVFVQSIPPILAGKFVELAPLLFPNQGVDEAWIDANLDVPKARKIIMDAARINDVTDFLGHLQSKMGLKPLESPATTA